MSRVITGIFTDTSSAAAAVDHLVEKGISREEISVLMSDAIHGHHVELETGSKMPEGATTGGVIGGTLGAILAGVAAASTLAIPGVGILAAGPLVAAAVGLGLGAASGGLIGALVGLGIPEHEAQFFADEVKDGKIMLAVHCDSDKVTDVRKVMTDAGAKKVATNSDDK